MRTACRNIAEVFELGHSMSGLGAPLPAASSKPSGGYQLPPGSLVILSPYVTQRDSRWFPEPERFDPDRFAHGRLEKIPEYAYFPFGAGPHVCIGNTFAMMEITLVVTTLVQRFHLELMPGQENLAPELKVSLRPMGGGSIQPVALLPAAPAGAHT